MKYTFDNIIKLNNINSIEYLISPCSPYFICNHYISTEIHYGQKKFIKANLKIKANDLLKNKNYNDIKNYDIIQIQVDHFDYFLENVLPIIEIKNLKIIIITSQWQLPQINKSIKTDNLLEHKNILLWISQNPIYSDNEKYMAIPYGFNHLYLDKYIQFVKSCNINQDKRQKIVNLYASPHSHLPKDHIRIVHDIFGKNSGIQMEYNDFLKNILDSEFVISTAGDRDDCFRHYECIGLNTIPVSNISGGYKEIFGLDMVYSNSEDMIEMIKSNTVNYNYKKPNREILTNHYWFSKINEKINKLKKSLK